jgi:hypothetical protein
MLVYNVTVNIENDCAEEWLQWMISKHIPDVLETGCFTENKIFRVMADEDSGGKTYSVQYYCRSMDDFNKYERDFALKLREEHTIRYKDKFVAFRTMLEVIK